MRVSLHRALSSKSAAHTAQRKGFVSNRGRRIFFETAGLQLQQDGDAAAAAALPLVLQHGWGVNRRSFAHSGYVSLLEQHFSLVLIDSLGHGRSDPSEDAADYALRHRAGDVVAVLDELGVERAAMFGYSMGGWVGTGMARFAPSRLSHLLVAGWDVACGTEHFDGDPRPASQPLRLAFDALGEVDGAVGHLRSLRESGVPTMVMCGDADPYFPSAERAAEAAGCDFTALEGDHVTAFTAAAPAVACIRAVTGRAVTGR